MSGRLLRAAVVGGALWFLSGCGGTGALTELSVGGNRTCVRFEDGTVKCWGGHATVQSLGKEYPGTLVPKRVEGLEHPTRLCAGRVFACAREQGGRVRCWTPEAEPRATETSGLSDVSALFCGEAGGCTLG
ncbi:MAG: hypothetical protein IRZ16_20325, partial [Myxococcaceae bacterium]|nr:hypothetical protein [Myxococcaceae bacterium]